MFLRDHLFVFDGVRDPRSKLPYKKTPHTNKEMMAQLKAWGGGGGALTLYKIESQMATISTTTGHSNTEIMWPGMPCQKWVMKF